MPRRATTRASRTSLTSLLAAASSALCLLALAPREAHAQSNADEWASRHARDALAQVGIARGAVPLLRLWALREWVDPAGMLEQIHAVATHPRAPAARRALAQRLEVDLRAQLGQLPQAERLVTDLGYITRWSVVGPFDNEGRAGFERLFPPETEIGAGIDPTRAYEGTERAVRWRDFPQIARLGYVALDAVARPARNACAFAHTTATATREGDAVLWLGAAGQLRAYVNGAEVYRDDAVRRAFPDRVGVRVRLHRGANRVLLKLCTDSHPMGFYARFTTPAGEALAGITHDADPANAPAQRITAPTPGQRPNLPRPMGVFADLRAAAEAPRASSDDLEAYARLLALTGGDNTASPTAPDLAARAAELGPTAHRWLLVADLATDRNRRLAAIERAVALSPNEAHVLAALGHERRLGAHPDEALPVLERAIAADDGDVVARVERAVLLDSMGLPLAARRELEEAAARAPRAAAVLRVRAAIAEHAQLGDELTGLRQAYARVRYDDVSVHEALARDARARGDRAAIRPHTEHMLALRPDRLELYQTVAELLEAAGEGDAAVGALARAVEIAPDEPSLWRSRGEFEVRAGRRDDGRTSLRRALALSPQDESLRQHIEALEPRVPRPDEALAEASDTFLQRRPRAGAAASYTVTGLQDLTVRTVYPNGLAGTFHQTVFVVNTREGADSSRNYTVAYEPDSQRFELRAARVFHPDGSVDESATVEEYPLTGGASGMYFDRRGVNVAFSHLTPGDVVEIRYRIDDVSQRNAFADYFGDLHVLQGEVPRAHVRYVLRAPAGRPFHFRVPELPRLTRAERDEGGTHVFDIEASDVAALPPEDHAPSLTERAAYIHVSTYRNWEEVGRWYWGLISDQLELDDRVRGIVRTVTRTATTPRERVRAIYNWVIQNTRYVALEFGIHGFLPYRVPQVCSRGFGDCKDKASTIVAMLREVGIEASIVLVRTRSLGSVATEPASLAVFNHAIVYVHPFEGYPQGLFLDGTAQDSGMDELPAADQGAMALVVNQRGEARLTTIPISGTDRNVIETRTELTVHSDRGAQLRVVQDFRGSRAAGVRASLEAQATREERLEFQLARIYPGVRVSNVRTNNYRDVDQPAHLEYEAQVPEVGARQGENVILPLLPALNLTRELASRSTRTSDVVFNDPPWVDDQRATIRVPQGATVVELPASARIESPFIALDLSVERQGAVINVRRVITYRVNRVPVAQYAAFREVVQRIDDAISRRATLRMSQTQAQANP